MYLNIKASYFVNSSITLTILLSIQNSNILAKQLTIINYYQLLLGFVKKLKLKILQNNRISKFGYNLTKFVIYIFIIRLRNQ